MKVVGYERGGLVRKLVCRVRGHTGICVRCDHRRPSNTRLFEEGRCARCGAYRWPMNW